MHIKKNKLNCIFYALITLFLLFSCWSMYMSLSNIGNLITALFVFAISATVILLYLFNNTLSKKFLILLTIYLLLIIPYVLLRGMESMQSISILLLSFPICALLISHLNRYQTMERFLKLFVWVVCCVAILSVFFWLFGSTLHILQSTGRVAYSWTGEDKYISTYFYLYFEPQSVSSTLAFISYRNCAIFTEAPVASFAFCTALFINEFLREKKSIVATVILIVTILTVQSTTGMVMLVLFFLFKIFEMHLPNRTLDVLLKGLLTLVCTVIAAYLVYTLVVDKLDTHSGSVRVSVMLNELEVFLENPLIGSGFNQYTKGSSNSITSLLADGGILLWGIYYVPLLGNIIYRLVFERKLDRFSILFVAMFAITAVQYTVLVVFIVLLSWCQLISRMKKKFSWKFEIHSVK